MRRSTSGAKPLLMPGARHPDEEAGGGDCRLFRLGQVLSPVCRAAAAAAHSGRLPVRRLPPGGQPFYALAGALLPLLEPGLSETDAWRDPQAGERLVKGEVSLAR